MLKPRGAICNLSCAYCYYLPKEQLYPGSDFCMSEAVLEAFTRQYLAAHPGPEVVFAWQGGEPLLMGLEFFERAAALQRQYCPPGKFVSNTIQTNAVLVNDDWARFFKRNNFLIGVSLDGPQAMHDAYRLDRGGHPSFERTMAGLRRLQAHGVEINLLTTVHSANAPHPLDVYRFLRDEAGVLFMQFIPIVERAADGGVTERSVGALEYGDFLTTIFDEWVRRDVGRVFVQLFDVALGVYLGHPAGLCIFAETCGQGLALEHTGDLYACDHFVDIPHRLGNIQGTLLPNLVASPGQRKFGLSKRASLPHECRACKVRFLCNGECPKNRFIPSPGGDGGLNYLCAGYKAFFTHIDHPMRLMAAELRGGRPATNIMAVKY